MSFLAKAPRGLLFVLPMLYAMCFSAMVLFKGFQGKTKVFFTIILSSLLIGYNVFLAQKNIFNYASTNYKTLANYLTINHIHKILLTNGKGIIPFLDKTIQTKLIANEQEIEQLKKQGYTHCLIDDYCRIAQLDSFVTLRKQQPIWQAPEPTLEAPLIYLDHSEFTGLSFGETLLLREKVKKDSIHLRLIRL